MTPAFLVFVAVLAILQLVLPKRLAFAPLLIAACHLGNIEIASELTAVRLLILIGLGRALIGGNFSFSLSSTQDKAFLGFAVVALAVSVFPREDIPSPIKQNLGLIFNVVGTYLYGRAYLIGPNLAERFALTLICVITPLSLFLSLEQQTSKNAYSALGSRHDYAMTREGRNRAQGPFKHPILAGTVGAACLPFAISLWKRKRKTAILGIAASTMIAVASASSGPLAAACAGLLALYIWKYRKRIGLIQKVALAMIIGMHITSTRGVWYLMAHMDLAGGSTGYHRAKLIDNAMAEIDRWWLKGTDYTRNWMFSGVSWSDRHTDITNYYLHLAVIGGLGLLFCLVWILMSAYRSAGKALKEVDYEVSFESFALWCTGSALFVHVTSFLSVSYFDQMYVLFYMNIALIPGLVENLRSSALEKENQVEAESRHQGPKRYQYV